MSFIYFNNFKLPRSIYILALNVPIIGYVTPFVRATLQKKCVVL